MYSSSESMVCGTGESSSVSGVVGVSSCGAASSFLLALESAMALSSKVLGAFLFLDWGGVVKFGGLNTGSR
jgi:hypothetical protein